MSGIYIHIPFCRQACHYCNFHFSVSQKRRPEFVKAMVKEISMQKDFFNRAGYKDEVIKTLYFGGGTPSVLDAAELETLFNALHLHFRFVPDAEITLEANPDDLDREKLIVLKSLGVNRLSIGIQSFQEADLRYMNRSHSANQAVNVLELAQQEGFENITADLIYGTPGMDDNQWNESIRHLTQRGIPHVSAYSLTVEKKTALEVFIRKGKAAPVNEEQSARQFHILCDVLDGHGYEHYEISNFGKTGYYSQHNLGYWSGVPYLGLGPSAHSFIPGVRQWNVANTCAYIDRVAGGMIPYEWENLSLEQQYNEYIMTALRTMWGIDKMKVRKDFGEDYLNMLLKNAASLKNREMVEETQTHLKVSKKGLFFADGIASELFIVD